MKLKDRQKAIIEFAKKNKTFQTKDLILFLDDKFSTKRLTIIRDLNKLFEDGIISKAGAGRGTFYFIQKDIDIEEYFEIPYEDRVVRESFNFEIFSILENNIFTKQEIEKLENLQKCFTKNISKYNSQTLINKEYERIMIEFSQKSSEIEGNTYSLLNTEALLMENVKDETKTDKETQMLLNHKDAFNESLLNKNKFLIFEKVSIEHLHSILVKNLNVTRNIRKEGVGITGTKYRPLGNEFQIRENLEKTVELINKKNNFFEKAFIALIMISYIQAFEDGNKRTARMCSNAILLAHNSIPLSYRIVNVVEYKKASILFYELNNFTYLKRIFIEQFEDSVGNYFNSSFVKIKS